MSGSIIILIILNESSPDMNLIKVCLSVCVCGARLHGSPNPGLGEQPCPDTHRNDMIRYLNESILFPALINCYRATFDLTAGGRPACAIKWIILQPCDFLQRRTWACPRTHCSISIIHPQTLSKNYTPFRSHLVPNAIQVHSWLSRESVDVSR